MDFTIKDTSSTSKVKRTVIPCKICASPAIYSYVGVIVCASCKMFFKRNAQSKEFRCYFNGLCQITEKNRHLCGYCRMKKCLDNGMQVDLLRNGRNTKKITMKKSQIHDISIWHDRTILSVEQWNLLANLVQIYDENGQDRLVERFLYDQSQLPVKMRFKIASIHDMLIRMMSVGPYLFQRNQDFLSLYPEDRSILIRKTLKHVIGLNCCFVTTLSEKFINNPALLEPTETLYGHQTVFYGRRTMKHLDVDPVFFKIFLSTLMFSTSDQTNFTGEFPLIFRDIK